MPEVEKGKRAHPNAELEAVLTRLFSDPESADVLTIRKKIVGIIGTLTTCCTYNYAGYGG